MERRTRRAWRVASVDSMDEGRDAPADSRASARSLDFVLRFIRMSAFAVRSCIPRRELCGSYDTVARQLKQVVQSGGVAQCIVGARLAAECGRTTKRI